MALVLGTSIISARAWGGETGAMKVFVSVIPQAYFVERIGTERVEVEVLVGPGQSPHTYEPSPKQMARLGEARIFFRVGIPLENTLVPKIARAFPRLDIVDTRKDVTFIPMDDHHGHSHGRGTPDPHIWLDPLRVKIQIRTICDALVRADPTGAERYRSNLAAFSADLDRLHGELQEVFAPLKGSGVYVYHPAFGYLADAYGFTQVAVESGGKEPSARQLANLVRQARDDGVRFIFMQPQFSKKNAQAIAREIGGAVVLIDPLPRDYIAEMRSMARTIRDSVAGQ